jgi:hypothetical protein
MPSPASTDPTWTTAPPLAPVRSLAYYRSVLAALTPEDLEPGYVAYVARQHARRLGQLSRAPGPTDSKARFDRQKPRFLTAINSASICR